MKQKILIITGGLSNERRLSLISGEDVTRALMEENTEIAISVLVIVDNMKMSLYSDPQLFLDRESQGTDLEKVRRYDSLDLSVLKADGYDVAFLALDGTFAEDGHIQALLNLTGIPYTGSDVMSSSIGMNKSKCYEFVSNQGVDVPEYFLVRTNNYDVDEIDTVIKNTFGYPCIVKPNDSGSSIGMSSPNKKDELEDSLKESFKHSNITIVQKFIRGREFACGIIGNVGDTELEILPVAESIMENFTAYTHEQKYYSTDIKDVCPAKIDDSLKELIMEKTKKVHEILDCDGLTRSDFRYDEESGKLYFLEINTLPGHTKNSICPQEAYAIGMTFGGLILKQIDLAILRKK
ncbi:MAG: D-alanine--D-alanine ligase [Candidatus Paceibacterota bacterium]